MIREVNMSDISDGRLYDLNDMVKADCGDCKGCSECCHVVGDTIILDPLDVYQLTTNTGMTFEQLMQRHIELHVTDGIILPSLKVDEKQGCPYLSAEGRCSIHTFRPGLCRIFPLGRYYEEETRSFRYFLQTNECKAENKTKIKVSKWIDVPNLPQNQKFIADWHYLLRDMQKKIQSGIEENELKQVNLVLLQTFYLTPYQRERDFYSQFYELFDKFHLLFHFNVAK